MGVIYIRTLFILSVKGTGKLVWRPESASRVIPWVPSTFTFETESLIETWSSTLRFGELASEPQGLTCLCLFSAGITNQYSSPFPAFSMGSGNYMEVHVCVASTLLTKLSFQHCERHRLMNAPRYVPPTTDIVSSKGLILFLHFFLIFLASNH